MEQSGQNFIKLHKNNTTESLKKEIPVQYNPSGAPFKFQPPGVGTSLGVSGHLNKAKFNTI